MPESTTPTLFEDWQARRARLSERPPAGGEALAPAQIHVLEYLIKRYEGTPEAAQPARFAVQSELFLNRRVMVVHHHLGGGPAASFKRGEDAESRASKILRRIKAQDPQGVLKSNERKLSGIQESGITLARSLRNTLNDLSETLKSAALFEFETAQSWLSRRFEDLLPVYQRRVLEYYFYSLVPPAVRPKCNERYLTPAIATEKLMRISHPEIPGYVLLAWRENLQHPDRIAAVALNEYLLLDERYREAAGELIRAELGNTVPAIRERALSMLLRLGNLQDIGILSDLLNLPTQPDEYPGEREAMLEAMRHLSEQPA
ncbi:MAG: hypothetical protein HY291_21310 [Planctomycetes bacterium]|nr:hypothetical protein [Planctomycetota bacterium]